MPPTYRSFAFAESLEGTKASMSKVKSRNPGPVPPYMPSNSNYDSIRRQSNSSILLKEEDEHSLADSGYDYSRNSSAKEEGVPSHPARYNDPTREDLEKTQPIPKEIVRSGHRRHRR